MQGSPNSDNLKEKKNDHVKPEPSSVENKLNKKRNNMIAPLYITRELKVTPKMLKSFNKRQEEVKNISYTETQFSRVYDEEIKSIMRNFRHLNSPTSLNLNFFHCEGITDAGARFVSDSLRHFNSLTSIHLNFSYCSRITDAGLRSISEGLRHHPSLTSIQLCFIG